MDLLLSGNLILLFFVSIIGAIVAKALKVPSLVGYIVSGVVFGSLLTRAGVSVEALSGAGVILLLFSVGIELSFTRLIKVVKIAFLGSAAQVILVTALSALLLMALGFSVGPSLILGVGFAMSSTAVVVKILSDRGELSSTYGEVAVGWLLIQDLMVIPVMILLSALAGDGGSPLSAIATSLVTSLLLITGAVLLGKGAFPFIFRKVASLGSAELLSLSAISLAIGVTMVCSYLGISPALGAFLAGLVISESQERHAVFAEIRPIRDIFVALFFVSLGFLVTPGTFIGNFGLILTIAFLVILVKGLVVFFVSLSLGYHGKTAVAASLGLSQVGEFALVIFSSAKALGLITSEVASLGIAISIVTLLVTPVVFKNINSIWRKLKEGLVRFPTFEKYVTGWDRKETEGLSICDHVIICGYGRVGSWIGKALLGQKVPFVVVDSKEKIISSVRDQGILGIYGDPSSPDVLNAAKVVSAKCVVVAIPDEVAQEEIVANVQTVNPKAKLYVRTHKEEEARRLTDLKVDAVIEPEFEAAIRIIRNIFTSWGKDVKEVSLLTKSLRREKTQTILST